MKLGNYVVEKIPDNLAELSGTVDIIFVAVQFSYTEIYNSISDVEKYGIKII